jgi:hypothetical protein
MSAETSWASSVARVGHGRSTTPYDTAIAGMCSVYNEGTDSLGPGRGTESAAARAAPSVPDERANAVEELRPSKVELSSQSGPMGELAHSWVQR